MRALWKLACDVGTLMIENKSNKNPITSQCLCSPGLGGGELCSNLHIPGTQPRNHRQTSVAGFLTSAGLIDFLKFPHLSLK